jgi:hypothetical protein
MKNSINQKSTAIDESMAIDFPHLGTEFKNIENVPGTHDQISDIFHHRLKRHLINSLNEVEKNPKSVNPIFNAKALSGAYKELLNAWDDEASREHALENLSANEEKMLMPAFQGLGDIVHGPDEELFGLMDFGTNNLSGLGRKNIVRKHATGVNQPTKKKGVFTKIKMASKHVKEEARNKGANLKKSVRKVGHAVIKFNPVAIASRAAFLVAMKNNIGKIASRVYWGQFTLEQAKNSNITPEYWSAAHKGWERLKNTFVNKLRGNETILSHAVSQGRAKYEKKRASGLNGIGMIDPQTITAILSLLKPILEALNSSFSRKKETEDSEPETDVELENTYSDDSDESVNGFILGSLLV